MKSVFVYETDFFLREVDLSVFFTKDHFLGFPRVKNKTIHLKDVK